MDNSKLTNRFNNYANYIVDGFLHDYNDSLSETQKEFGLLLRDVNFILVENILLNKDLYYKNKRKEDKKYQGDASLLVPLVSNGKVEGDGYIHVYLDAIEASEYSKKELLNVIEKRILHEVIGKFIRPETPFDDVLGSAEVLADHYFSNGLIEYYSRTFDKRHFNGNGDDRYDKSYNDISFLVKSFKRSGLSNYDINRLIFKSNYAYILNYNEVGKKLLDRYMNDVLNRKAIIKLANDIFKSLKLTSAEILEYESRIDRLNNESVLQMLRDIILNYQMNIKNRNDLLSKLDYYFRDLVDDNEINSSPRMYV